MRFAAGVGLTLVAVICLAGPITRDLPAFTVPVPPIWEVTAGGDTWYVLDGTARTNRSRVNQQLQHWAWVYKEHAINPRQEVMYAVQGCGMTAGILYEVDRRGDPAGSLPVMAWTKGGRRVVDHLAHLICLASLHRALNIPAGPQQRLSPDAT